MDVWDDLWLGTRNCSRSRSSWSTCVLSRLRRPRRARMTQWRTPSSALFDCAGPRCPVLHTCPQCGHLGRCGPRHWGSWGGACVCHTLASRLVWNSRAHHGSQRGFQRQTCFASHCRPARAVAPPRAPRVSATGHGCAHIVFCYDCVEGRCVCCLGKQEPQIGTPPAPVCSPNMCCTNSRMEYCDATKGFLLSANH